jgi:iron-sulfur cluster assembly accessory protein
VGVRLGVKTTGCSGLAYKLEYADDVAPEDIVFEGHGVKVLVDPKSLPYIDGTELDFVREGPERGLQVPQPAREGPLRLRRVVPGEAPTCLVGKLDDDDFTLFGLPAGMRSTAPNWTIAGAPCRPGAPRPLCRRRRAAAQRLAMQWAVRVNEAYQRLKDPLKRAAYLCELAGAPSRREQHGHAGQPS